MLLRWVGPEDHYLESYPCRDHEEPDGERCSTALASGLFISGDPPEKAVKKEVIGDG